MDSDHGKSSDQHGNSSPQNERTHVAATMNVDNFDHSKLGNYRHVEAEQSCSMSSSETSSDEDFFQLDASELNKSVAGLDEMLANNLSSDLSVEQMLLESGVAVAGNHQVVNASQTDHKSTIAEPILPSKLEVGTAFSPNFFSVSPGSDTYNALGVKQSPPIQLMGRFDVPDPNRIPSSIFARTSTTPMEWSVASNESLFSIHMGKSGDLTGFYNSQLDSYLPISPVAVSSPTMSVGLEHGFQQQGSAEAANAEAMKEVLRAAAEGQVAKDKPSCDSASRSDGSVNSYRSFAFPILTAEGRNGSLKGESVHKQKRKEEPQHPPVQKQEPPKAEPVASASKWFPWCSCCPLCC